MLAVLRAIDHGRSVIQEEVTVKLHARMLEALSPVDPAGIRDMLAVLEDEIVPYAQRERGFRHIFFLDRAATGGNVFSITIYDTEKDLHTAMKVADSELRSNTLGRIGCRAVSAKALGVIAGV